MADKNTEIYQLPLHKDLDGDIIQFLRSIPRHRKAGIVRQALRSYMENVGQLSISGVQTPTVDDAPSPVEPSTVRGHNKRPIDLEL